jgi:hypothetical protein
MITPALGAESQSPAIKAGLPLREVSRGSVLGNPSLQAGTPQFSEDWFSVLHLSYWLSPYASRAAPSQRFSRLESLKRERFAPEGKAERVARSLAALDQPPSIHLSAETWRQIIEEAESEDEF